MLTYFSKTSVYWFDEILLKCGCKLKGVKCVHESSRGEGSHSHVVYGELIKCQKHKELEGYEINCPRLAEKLLESKIEDLEGKRELVVDADFESLKWKLGG